MSYEQDLSYVYEHVFSKVRYDKNLNTYIIYKEDYIPLKLSTKQFQILKQMCKRQGVILEEEPYRLPGVEDEKLFQEYNQINQIIISSGIPKEDHPLNLRRIEIRNQIVMDNLPLVRAIIDRNFEGIQQLSNKDEIYQLGYLMLITYIDNGSILEPQKFTIHLSSKLMFDIKEKILNAESSISAETSSLLEKLRQINNFSSNEPRTKTDLAQTLNIEPKKVDKLLNMDRFLSALSIDEELKKLGHTKKSKISSSPLYDDSFETELIKSTARDIIIKIINTLPSNQKEVLMLSYGFLDGRSYNDVEIANILGVTKSRVGFIRHTALDNLRLSIRSKYLIDYDELVNLEDLPEADEKQLKALEEIIIGLIPKDELLNYLSNIPKLQRDILLLYYGLIDGKECQMNEISEILKVSKSTVVKHKYRAYISLKEEILKSHNLDTITYKEYIDYLIEKYIIHQDIKKRKW